MSRGSVLTSALVILISQIAGAPAQDRYRGGSTVVDTGFTIRMDADWVYVNARVWDPKTKTTVDDLGKEDFVVHQDGIPRDIYSCQSGEVPFHLLLLTDVSASTSRNNSLIRKAAVHFAEQLKAGDQIGLISFNDRADLLLPFTADKRLVERAAEGLKADGGTAFYDALSFALRIMSKVQGRKAIVVFSDGADNRLSEPSQGSRTSFSSVRRAVRQSDCLIYTVFLLPYETKNVRDSVLQQAESQMRVIAEETGGRMYAPGKPRDLSRCYGEIAEDLRHIYTLTFTPGLRRKSGWHEISVSVPRRPELVVHSRKGYGESQPVEAE